MTIETTIRRDGPWSASLTVSADHPRASLADDLTAALDEVPPALDGTVSAQIWIEQVRPGDDEAISRIAQPYRDLYQLRRPLPAEPSGLRTRPFDPAADVEEWIRVNNRAFSWHPEQGGRTRAEVEALMAEPWFDAEGFRILEIDGRMAGFCWTKVHRDTDPVLGEIYVIAVDPDFHGRGLGGPMTLAGLEWLTAQGIGTANLYVESDNHPALATYDRLGFTLHSINRAYSTVPVPA